MNITSLNYIADFWGQAILRGCVAGTIAFIVAWCIIRFWKSAPHSARPWFWRLAYLKLIVALVISGSISVPLLHHGQPDRTLASENNLLSNEIVTSDKNDRNSRRVTALPSPDPANVHQYPTVAESQNVFQAIHPIAWLMFLWVIGAIWCLFRLAGEWCAAEWLRRLAVDVSDLNLLRIYGEVCRDFGITRRPRLCLVEGAGSPALLCGFTSTILLPKGLIDDCSDAETRLIMAHELAHFRRMDLIWTILPAVAHCLCYFLPTEWLAAREYRVNQEIATDALVVQLTEAGGGEYGATLVRVVSHRTPVLQTRVATVGIVESAAMLKRRLAAMNHQLSLNIARKSALNLVSRALLFLFVLALPAWKLSSSASAADYPSNGRPDGISYRFKQGESYVYNIKFEADEADYTETMHGNAIYRAVRVADGMSTLTCNAALLPLSRLKNGTALHGPPLHRLRTFGFGGVIERWPIGQSNEVKIDSAGRVLTSKGGVSLPRALGNLPELILESLGSGQSWESGGTCNIAVETVNPISPISHFGRSITTNYPAQERTSYTLGNSEGNAVNINKRYEMHTNEMVSGAPRIELTGNGNVKFDTVEGIPTDMSFDLTMIDRPDRNTTVSTPIKLSYHLVKRGDVITEDNESATSSYSGSQEPIGAVQRENTLADLSSQDKFKKMNAANRLASAVVGPDRSRVARALEANLNDKDGFVRSSTIKALVIWGDSVSVPKVIASLNDESFAVRWAAFDTLGFLKDGRAAAPIAKWLKSDQAFASKALKNLGPASVPAVLPYLKDPEWSVRMEACNILKEVGSKANLSALQQATHDSNGIVTHAAQEAIKAIRGR